MLQATCLQATCLQLTFLLLTFLLLMSPAGLVPCVTHVRPVTCVPADLRVYEVLGAREGEDHRDGEDGDGKEKGAGELACPRACLRGVQVRRAVLPWGRSGEEG